MVYRMEVNSLTANGPENGPVLNSMAYSPGAFGVGENVPKSKTLFSDSTDSAQNFNYSGYHSSASMNSVYSSTMYGNNTGVSMLPAAMDKPFNFNMFSLNNVSTKSDRLGSDSGLGSGLLGPKGDSINGEISNNLGDSDSSDHEEPVECGNCNGEFSTLQEYMDHECKAKLAAENKSKDIENMNCVGEGKENDLSDVESFDGKIVYNPDGSAYIIEGDSDLSDLDSLIDIPQKEKLIIDKRGGSDSTSKPAIPRIDSAFFVPRNPASFFNSIYAIPRKHEAPIMHNYRVYEVRSGKHKLNSGDKLDMDSKNQSSSSPLPSLPSSSSTPHPEFSSTSAPSNLAVPIPTKPILMCFICKLSFGYAKSFVAHSVNEHSMQLNDEEKEIMSRRNSSAIIQGIGKDQEPLMSFLEPLKQSSSVTNASSPRLRKSENDSLNGNLLPASHGSTVKDNTSVSYVYSKPKLSDSVPVSAFTQPSSSESLSGSISEPHEKGQLGSSSNEDMLNVLSSSGKSLSFKDAEEDSQLSNTSLNKTGTPKPDELDENSKSESESGFSSNHMSRMLPEDLYRDRKISTPISKSQMASLQQYPRSPYTAGGFYGMCEEHPAGRPQGVECPSCDMVLSSSQSLGGHMTMMHSRNSCKTLKCPKCNWHYKYQETLEIHMKEKHPDGDQKCLYCISNQTHPRLARGESYSCGYKPYRCDVCNYSTTTKGNLSIHMQSDKHLNNVQDMANNSGERLPPSLPQPPPPPPPQTPQQPPPQTPPHQVSSSMSSQIPSTSTATGSAMNDKKNMKPKPTWRCDVCNYETNVARNLRIHMTSEKHTHNMMVLQQNMKHMQRDMQLHQMNQLMMLQQDPSFLGLAGPVPGGVTFPYDGSLLMGGMPPGFGGEVPMDLSKENEVGVMGGEMDRTTDSSRLFQCCVCNSYATDSLDALHQHLQMDRTKQREHENIMVENGTYICNLCTYKTNLKANFQLHCKTDKHLQRLQLVNHIKEGGSSNEWRLKYLNVSNPVQVRCNSCDYYTNSIHKLQIHTGNPRHEASAQIFAHLLMSETKLATSKDKSYQCILCNFSSQTKIGLMQHVHSMQHLHSENMKQIQMKEQGQIEIDIGDIFKVVEVHNQPEDGRDNKEEAADRSEAEDGEEEDGYLLSQEQEESRDLKSEPVPLKHSQDTINNNNTIKETDNNTSVSGNSSEPQEQAHACPFCNFSCMSEMKIQSHILSQHSNQSRDIVCPLCQEPFEEKVKLERHLTSVHNVTTEGLQRLLLMVDNSKWTMPPTVANQTTVPSRGGIADVGDIDLEVMEAESARLAAEEAIDTASPPDKDGDDQFRCQTCSKTFSNIDSLYAHQNELGHLELKQTPRGPGYLCWKKGCNQYFKTAQALQIHFREIHAKTNSLSAADRSVFKFPCSQCTLAFKSQEKLQLHAQFHFIKSALCCNYCTKSFNSITSLKKHVEAAHDLTDAELEQYHATVSTNAAAIFMLLSTSGMEKLLHGSSATAAAMVPNDINSATGKGAEDSLMAENSSEDSLDGKMDSSESLPNSTSSTPDMQENGLDKDSVGSIDNLDKNDLSAKEQQFFEDYINSQAFAEGSYEDPLRKYKCHRCKVAFTKQNYLTAHNKTLTHRKGDRLSYPMEKYLDPNRPFKCDTCKESFTQKNILLVHYNSVSHLHKVKQSQQQQGVVPTTTAAPTSSQAQSTSASSTASTSVSLTPSTTPAPEKSSSKRVREIEDEGARPYKCNICKVAYSQGSTLDIHVRSVAHQTRTSKLQELALAGEIDLTRPLIEEPTDPQKIAQHQQQKILSEILQKQSSLAISQPSLIFQGLPGMAAGMVPGLPPLPLLSAMPPLLAPGSLANPVLSFSTASLSSSHTATVSTSSSKSSSHSVDESAKSQEKSLSQNSKPTPQKSDYSIESSILGSFTPIAPAITPSANGSQSQSILSGSIHLCQRCNAVFANPESFLQHQLFCSMTSGSAHSPMSSSTSLAMSLASAAASSSQQNSRPFVRVKPQVQRNLLENIGFECVMQFNEFNQAESRAESEEREEEEDKEEKKDEVEKMDTDTKENEKPEVKIKTEEEVEKENSTDAAVPDLPELNKCVCSTCKKEFSSVWVLKAHQEEVHKELVPIDMVEDFGEQFKTDLEKKQPKENPENPNPGTGTQSGPSSTAEEITVKKEMPPPPPPQHQAQADMMQMVNMFGMMPMHIPIMNMQPPLMPMMMPPGLDPGLVSPLPVIGQDNNAALNTQKQLQQAAIQNQKRARTRINDEQLKILRGYFDINNSPSDEQIQSMSEQSGLPMKVIKHWFRNTLFKERQRNKDSPYNFNNPPSTTLDLEEYEKTGKLPAMPEEEGSNETNVKEEPKEKIETAVKVKQEESHSVPLVENIKIERPASPPHKPISNPNPNPQPSPVTPSISQSYHAFQTSNPRPQPHSTGLNDSMEMESHSDHSSLYSMGPGMTPTSRATTPTTDDIHRPMHSPNSSGGGRRANRTRFTDYQVKMLQEYFEQNAYPKDDELDHLSKMLNLSPRVIVVWFQNARQKARKIYENQPPIDLKDTQGSETTPFQRTAGLNYQCRKCNAVFQRYYDLIRHQKGCFGEGANGENDPFSDDDSNSISHDTSFDEGNQSDPSSVVSERSKAGAGKESTSDLPTYKCEKCNLSFNRLELWREHQNVHSMNPGLFLNLPSSSAFGVLQNMAAAQHHQQHSSMMQEERSPLKRKLEEDMYDDRDEHDQPRDKRLRTTILPEQLDYLYQKYQIDCNPSRKQLEAIASDVGLKKRVVQVWFQNTRARERKGQYRAHQQLIHKRCPICRALFRAKSALESHLATKHPEEMAKGEINVDAIPDAVDPPPPTTPGSSGPVGGMLLPPSPDMSKLLTTPPSMLSLLPPASLGMPGFPPAADPIQLSMKQFYEDSFKKYINELSSTSHAQKASHPLDMMSTPVKMETVVSSEGNDAPLDLSKPLKISTDHQPKQTSYGPSTDSGARSYEDHSFARRQFSLDDSMSETHSEMMDDNSSNVSSNPTSPATQTPPQNSIGNKRYRTQMTSVQVRIMKRIFMEYKTPTMAECEMLGREIGLQKRVVQVWFQNARAKEKKAKLNMPKSLGELDFPKPPEECSMCKFKYSHKYTIQDHIFTKRHIENVRAFIQNQSDVERDLTSPSGMGQALRQQQSEVDRMRKALGESSMSQSQLAQLQAMGMGPLGMPPGMAGMMPPSDMFPEMKKESSSSHDKEKKETDKKSEGSSKKEHSPSSSELAQLQGMNFLSPFGGFLPGMDPSMMPFMYPGVPGMIPGMGLPLMQPGFMPGAEMLAYDPMTFGTPLPLLQIPQQAIKDVSMKLTDPKASVGQYTQDCKSISSLRSMVGGADYNCAREATVDVGYICKKCQMVYPAKDACVSHQRMVCFAGGKIPEGINPLLKLEQIQYECKLCTDKVSTVQEFKSHCQQESHKAKVVKYQQQKANQKSASATYSSSTTPSVKQEPIIPSKVLEGSSSADLSQAHKHNISANSEDSSSRVKGESGSQSEAAKMDLA